MKVIITILLVAAIAIFLRKLNPKKKSAKRDSKNWNPQTTPSPIPTPKPIPTPTPRPIDPTQPVLSEEPKKKNNTKSKK